MLTERMYAPRVRSITAKTNMMTGLATNVLYSIPPARMDLHAIRVQPIAVRADRQLEIRPNYIASNATMALKLNLKMEPVSRRLLVQTGVKTASVTRYVLNAAVDNSPMLLATKSCVNNALRM